MAYVPSDGLPWRRSCVILYQACTWAPKRNQVFSESLISRDGPSWAKAGTGDVGGGFSAGSFSVCDCAEAAPAIPQTRTASAARWMKSLLLFEALPMSSSSLSWLRRKIPLPRTRRVPCTQHRPTIATGPGKRFRRAKRLGRPSSSGPGERPPGELRDPLQRKPRHVECGDLQEGVNSVGVDVQLGGQSGFLQRRGEELRIREQGSEVGPRAWRTAARVGIGEPPHLPPREHQLAIAPGLQRLGHARGKAAVEQDRGREERQRALVAQ